MKSNEANEPYRQLHYSFHLPFIMSLASLDSSDVRSPTNDSLHERSIEICVVTNYQVNVKLQAVHSRGLAVLDVSFGD